MKKHLIRVFSIILLTTNFVQAQVTRQKSLAELKDDLEKVEQSLETTRERIKTIRDARFLPELYFILAELHVQKGRYMYSIKMMENKDVPQDELDFTPEKKPKLQAIELYQQILDKFPTNPDRDKALFFMAHEYRELGDLEKMVETYNRLTREFPNSLFWSESQLIVANYILETKKDVDFAIELYQKILARPPDHFTPLARYKLGYAYINKALWVESLLAFEGVLTKDANLDMSKLPDVYKKTDVKRDALTAMVWPYSEINEKEMIKLGPKYRNPLEYFRGLSNGIVSYQKVLQKLGRRLGVKKRFIDATRVYFALLQAAPDLETRMDAVEESYKSMKDTQLPWPIFGYVEEVAKTANLIKHSNLSDKEKKAHLNNYEIYARDVSTRMQKRAKENRNKPELKAAIYAYLDYLWAFGDSKFRATIELNLAETYFILGDRVQAGRWYERVAKRFSDLSKQKPYWDSALQSYTQALKDSAGLNLLELTEARNGLRDVGQVFITKYKSDRAIPELVFNIGRTHYDERNFDEAVKSFEMYLGRYPNGTNARLASDLILDSYNQKEDYDGLIGAGNKMLANRNLPADLRSNVQNIVKQAQFKKIQAKSGDYSSPDYAKNLLKFAQQYKGSDIGEQALYEAFVSLKAKKDPAAYAPGEALLLKHSNSKYAKDVVSQMGQMALVTADFRRAAVYFESYSQKYPSDPQSKQLLQSAAQMREAMGDYNEASRNYQSLGNSEGVARSLYLSGNWGRLVSVAPAVGGVKGAYYEGLALYRLGRNQQAKPKLEAAANSRGSSFEENTMSAHALYLLSMDAMKSYEQVQMTPGKENQAVQDKSKMLDTLTAQLNRVIQFGNGRWTIAALYGLGRANDEFAQFIRKAPQPAGLNAAQLQQYKQAINAQAAQFDGKAKGFFKQCLQNAEKFEVFTSFVKGCQTLGREIVDEARETKTVSRAGQAPPAQATTIRTKLYDDSRNVGLLIQLAQVYAQNQDYSMAQTILNRAIEVNPNSAQVIALQGSISLFMNELDVAALRFKDALKKNGGDSTALWGMAGLYRAFGYSSKFTSTKVKAKSAGRPLNPIHPFVQGAM